MPDDRFENEILNAQLRDAIRHSLRWGAGDLSDEERLYLRRMQTVLNDWSWCVESHISGWESRLKPHDCAEHPRQFLYFYKKALEVRGGQGAGALERLAEKVTASAAHSIQTKNSPSSRRRTENREKVDAFIERVWSATQRRVTRKDIRTVAGYDDKTQFLRFQSGDRSSSSATENFNRVLKMDPSEFINRLNKHRGK